MMTDEFGSGLQGRRVVGKSRKNRTRHRQSIRQELETSQTVNRVEEETAKVVCANETRQNIPNNYLNEKRLEKLQVFEPDCNAKTTTEM